MKIEHLPCSNVYHSVSSNNRCRAAISNQKITSFGGTSISDEGDLKKMLLPTILGLLVGMVLAQRFKVMALFPVIVLTLFVASGAAIVHPAAAWTLGLTAILTMVGLQAGYLSGIGIRHVTALTRASRRRAALLANSISPQRPAH